MHPDNFTVLSSERLFSDSILSIDVYKSFNNEFFAIVTSYKSSNINVDLYNSKGERKYFLKINDINNYALQRCYVSSDGELLHFDFVIPFWEVQGNMLKSYKSGKLICSIDSISTSRFNIDNDILTYFRTNREGYLYYKNFKTGSFWNKKILNELTYTGFLSNNGRSIIVHTINKFIAIDSVLNILWIKNKNNFNGNIELSDLGMHLIHLESNEVQLYTLDKFELIWTKSNIDIIGRDKYPSYAYFVDNKNLMFISTGNKINVYDLDGRLLKELPIKATWFDVNYNHNKVDFFIDSKTHYVCNENDLIIK